MDDIQTVIVHLLQRYRLKPGELSKKIGVSRQALHRHLRLLVDAKRIRKHGEGPHVSYSSTSDGATNTRVEQDETLCREQLLPRYLNEFTDSLEQYIRSLGKRKEIPTRPGIADLEFLLDTAAVYSSNIEGNTLDLNSFLNSRTSPRKHRPKEAQEIEDLVSAYEYAKKHALTEKNILSAHKILSREFVALSRQGIYRKEPVGVFSRQGLVYMAVEAHLVPEEMRAVFTVVRELLNRKLTLVESFFWASWLHLMIALVHPFSDGNGRTARLCEKWFLATTLGDRAFGVASEECYWNNRSRYYAALKLGVNYWEMDMGKAFPFFALLPGALHESIPSSPT